MAGALIGEAFLSASIQTLCDKIASGDFLDFSRGKKLDHSLLERLKLTFLALDAVLDDAEEKQIEKPRVKKWLDELKHAVFDAEDLLAEIDAEALQSRVEAEEYQTKTTSQVWNFFSTSLNPFYQGMNGRIQELFQKVEHLAKQIDLLGLKGGVKEKVSQKTPTTSFVGHDFSACELAWGREEANDSIKERHVLESLQPSANLVKLTIKFYGGTSFPDWLGDSSFANIQVMRISDCGTCFSLPPVGRLPALKELYIERMKLVVSIGVEFYGGNGASLSQPFQSLKKLEFKEMPEWEEWLSSPGRGQSPDFPRLEVLILEKCPKLKGNLPDHLPSLRKLRVSDCGVLHERATRTRWIPWSLIVNTESLRQSLKQLKIVRCPGLSSLLETESLCSLWNLEIQFFSRPDCLQPHFSSCLGSLSLVNCASLLSFPRNGLPTSLTYLEIKNCRRLEFLSHEMMAKLTSLRHLDLVYSCDSLRSFPLGVFPKLSYLSISGSKSLESLAIGEGADDENLTHLDDLWTSRCPNLVSFPHGGLPTPKLARFVVQRCENLKLLPGRIHTLTALRDLSLHELPNVESFAEGGLPPNLQSFRISRCEKLRPSVEYWGLQRIVSLRTFDSSGSEDVLETVLKEQLLPTTLHTLAIGEMKSLKSLEGKGLQHLTSLQELKIGWWDSLEFLPKEGLPASLSFLSIEKCSSLKKRCQKKTGQEWSKIAHIPFIKIDDQDNIIQGQHLSNHAMAICQEYEHAFSYSLHAAAMFEWVQICFCTNTADGVRMGDDDHKTKMRARFLWSTALMLELVGSQYIMLLEQEELMEICYGSRDGSAAMSNKDVNAAMSNKDVNGKVVRNHHKVKEWARNIET
ncbi:hypothetical protein DVH24_013585 [Malus domestica]|uniref:Uncharacterized protein n=1 Tax=Malus domestica TaxID=3750 RepID=A0A498JB23_MALDO|nr:hypothetical protein DVH24_013585 [Malus domestica]